MYHASVSKTFRHPIPQFSSDIRVREGVKLTMTQKKKNWKRHLMSSLNGGV